MNTLNFERGLIGELIEQYRKLDRAENTVVALKNSLARFDEHMSLDYEGLKSLNKKQAQDILIDLSNKYSNSTVKLSRTYINELYKFAELDSPFVGCKLKTQKRNDEKDTIDFFEINEVERILHEARNQKNKHSLRDFAIMKLMFNTGMRKSELTKLDIDDLNFDKSEIILRSTKREERTTMQVGSEAMEAVKEYLDTRDDDLEPVFLSSYKSRISSSGIDRIMKSVFEKANAEGSPHKVRHSMCSIMADKGFSLSDIQERARHTSSSTTMRYISQSNSRKKQVADNLGF